MLAFSTGIHRPASSLFRFANIPAFVKHGSPFSSESWREKGPLLLFLLALSVYLVTRFLYLEDYPVYFFTDEAAEQVRARGLWNRHFFDENGHFLPVTAAGPWFRFVSIAHYIQLPGWLLFGNSIYAVRGTAVLLTAWGMYGLGLTLKTHFNCRSWWLAPLVMVTMPAWFVHSRTAFECVYTVVFYTWFCYYYLNYTAGNKKAIFAAVGFGALTLYSYSAGPLVMFATGGLLLLSDAKYHWQNRRIVGLAFALACLTLVPLGLYYLNYPESPARHIEMYSGVLSTNMPLTEKLRRMLGSYSQGLLPEFWFTWKKANIRHQIAGLSHILPVMAPLFFGGLALILFRIKRSGSRLLLATIAASSAGALFVAPEITRNLTFLLPACILIMVAADTLVQWLPARSLRGTAYAGLFSVLAVYSLFLTRECLQKGPTSFHDYTLFGLQWGSKQVIRDAIPDYLRQHPGETVVLAAEWANSPDYILEFFNSPPNFKLGDVDQYMNAIREIPDHATFVVTQQQFERLGGSTILTHEDLGKVIYYPDGSPAFRFVRIKYVADAERILKDEVVERQRLRRTRSRRRRAKSGRSGTGPSIWEICSRCLMPIQRAWVAGPGPTRLSSRLIFPRQRPCEACKSG